MIRARCLALLIVLLCLLGGPRPAQPVVAREAPWAGLAPAVNVASGGDGPWDISAGDLTGDGLADLLVVNRRSTTISLLAGAADGALYQRWSRPAGADPRHSLLADLNADGLLDVVVVGYFANGMTVWLGQENGELGAGAFYPLTGHGNVAAAADLNADGLPDLIATSSGSGQSIHLHVFFGTSSGVLSTPPAVYPTRVGTAKDIAAGDVDGDGHPDIVVSTGDGPAPILVFQGRLDGTLAPPAVLPSLAEPPALSDGTDDLALADLDGDGARDILVGHNDPPYEWVSLRSGRGDGTFEVAQIVPAIFPSALATADLDRDGRLDLIATGASDDHVRYWLQQPDSVFSSAVEHAVGREPAGVAVADFNGDGLPDLAVANRGDASISLLLNRGVRGARYQLALPLLKR